MDPYASNCAIYGQSSDPSLASHQALRLSGSVNVGDLGNAAHHPSEEAASPYTGEARFTRQKQQLIGLSDIAPAWNTSSHPPLGKHPWAKKGWTC